MEGGKDGELFFLIHSNLICNKWNVHFEAPYYCGCMPSFLQLREKSMGQLNGTYVHTHRKNIQFSIYSDLVLIVAQLLVDMHI